MRGRHNECDVLDRLLSDVRAGQSRALGVRGEAGIGKTSLLDYLAARATECRVIRAAGVESEMDFAFAGLHQLCAPFLDRLDRLPAPQRDAMSAAFGLRHSDAPDLFLVGLALLSLLSDIAEDEPLICLVDDAQWLDQASAQALAFVSRRLLAESVGLVFATRSESAAEQMTPHLSELHLTGLGDADARALLQGALRSPLDAPVFAEILAEARGNPLALLELPRSRTPTELTFGFAGAGAVPLAGRMEQGFLRQLQPLPAATRRLLLIAAVEPVGDVTVLWQAAQHLGIPPGAAAPAEAAELIELGTRVRFRHPLLRSAVCRAADVRDLREVHGALAHVVTLDPDRRAWHRGQACAGPDENVAGELERSADRAHTRGGFAAAGAFLQRSAELTPEPSRRGARLLAAAQARLHAGEFDATARLLGTCESERPDDLQGARIDLLRAQLAFASSHSSEAAPLLLAAARRLEPLDVALARETYLDAFNAAMFAGRLTRGVGLQEIARAARRAPTPPNPQHSDLLLEGLSALFTDGYAAATPIGHRVLQAFRNQDATRSGTRWLWLASITAADLWDDESWHDLSSRHLTTARETGALSELPLALHSRIVVQLFAGELTTAAHLLEESKAVAEATGGDIAPYGALALAAWQGREDHARALTATAMDEIVFRGEGIGITVAQWTSALLFNGLGRYDDAVTAAQQAAENPQELGAANWGLTELVEAASRSGRRDLAVAALERLSQMTKASNTGWALGVEARSRALVTDGAAAEPLYREAISHLRPTRVKAELARAHLLYGEWLRREGRRIDAREHLRAAHDMFVAFGAGAFSERARRELHATGETARRRVPETEGDLTDQELQIARLAAQRHTNPEIGAQLFLSPRTVEWHLRKVFTKLGVSSRRELVRALPSSVVAARSL
ncbi:transcriptional regulator [Pseudonocardia sulfidoxydans NBRC 16205]|uniref:Transcriptional regulator n=1 Tax=Pseudonocardia sulfidoxydans NBRC 16205 TaxID=1223511 RepID=A0A511DMR7_9PSEU|nr:LuxR family transcriptional regulator [Pseudonocardia sulfidoxydans]GEL25667.1 transcriptional regulator [Pseudonocardia sulfidoxydans NBRC 16205]